MSRGPKVMFQVRAPSGRIHTVMAHSERGAVKKYVEEYDPPSGRVDVKERGTRDWSSFKVS